MSSREHEFVWPDLFDDTGRRENSNDWHGVRHPCRVVVGYRWSVISKRLPTTEDR